MGSCLSCRFLGDTMFGHDVDDIFYYMTPKVVIIKDRSLGLTKYGLTLLIFLYVVVYQVAYLGEHFKVEEVTGVARLQWQQPTIDGCNPTHLDCRWNLTHAKELPYCSQYRGPDILSSKVRRTCEYEDAWALPIQLPTGVLMPTHRERFSQKRMCDIDAPECSTRYRFETDETGGVLQRGQGEARPSRDRFVADVEDFTVLIDHAFSTFSGDIAYDDYKMQGYWLDCSGQDGACVKKPIGCAHEKCREMGFSSIQANHSPSKRHLRKSREVLSLAAEAATESDGGIEKKIIALVDGDVISLRQLLKMAQSSANMEKPPVGGYDLDDIVNSEGDTMRMRGAALVVRIDYTNVGHWRLINPIDPPTYTISVTRRPSDEFKHFYVPTDTPDGREVVKAYGVMIVVQQVGRICTFSFMYSIIAMTAALGLLAMANVLTDYLALYFMPNSAIYTALKYQESEDLVTVNPESAGRKS